MKSNYKEFDFSGDVGIEAWGVSLERMLEHAAAGLFSLMSSDNVDKVVERHITVASDGEENLVVDWLSELISSASLHGEIYCSTEVCFTDRYSIDAIVRGEPIDSTKHSLRFEVKAATYHRLVVRKTEDGYCTRIVFDL